MFAYSAHSVGVLTPYVAVVEPFRAEIAWVQWLTGTDEVPEWLNQFLQCAFVGEASPLTTPHSFVLGDAPFTEIIDKPDYPASIDVHVGVKVAARVKD